MGLIAELEAGIDFAEDDIDVMAAERIAQKIAEVRAPLQALERSFAYGRVVREGFRLAIVGRPNAGKSSLFNRLVERERAIVTAAPGTTRDTVTEHVSMEGIPVELIDTAGLREGVDEAERMGVARSREAMAEADVVLLVVDATVGISQEDRAVLEQGASGGSALLVAWNKSDLVDEVRGSSSRGSRCGFRGSQSSDDLDLGADRRRDRRAARGHCRRRRGGRGRAARGGDAHQPAAASSGGTGAAWAGCCTPRRGVRHTP